MSDECLGNQLNIYLSTVRDQRTGAQRGTTATAAPLAGRGRQLRWLHSARSPKPAPRGRSKRNTRRFPLSTECQPQDPLPEREPAALLPLEERSPAPLPERPEAPLEERPAAPLEEWPAVPLQERPPEPLEERPAAVSYTHLTLPTILLV